MASRSLLRHAFWRYIINLSFNRLLFQFFDYFNFKYAFSDKFYLLLCLRSYNDSVIVDSLFRLALLLVLIENLALFFLNLMNLKSYGIEFFLIWIFTFISTFTFFLIHYQDDFLSQLET